MKDPCIRKILRKTELAHYILDPESIVVEELKIPLTKSRIDIAVVNGNLHGYEVKSASDSLSRLPHQIMGYSKVFDLITIATEAKYAERIYKLVPEWIGIIVCENINGLPIIKLVQNASQNPAKEGLFVAKLLWHDELIELASTFNVPHKKSDRNWLLCQSISTHIDLEQISKFVRLKLKSRQNWKVPKEYCALM